MAEINRVDYLRSHGVSESKFRADVLKAYNNVNLCPGPSITNSVICKLQKGQSYKVWDKVGNWSNLRGNQWVYNDSSYIRYKKEASSVDGSLQYKVKQR